MAADVTLSEADQKFIAMAFYVAGVLTGAGIGSLLTIWLHH